MNNPLEAYPKFYALDAEKRERIINAAMKEFQHGYALAKTDNIVREAGISKGLLFHYFGTKDNLYAFLIYHTVALLKTEYVDLIDRKQPDLLESVWQISLLKQNLAKRHPGIFDFLSVVYLDTRHPMNPEQAAHMARFVQIRGEILADMLKNCDKSLFRDGVDPEKVVNIIDWSLTGCAETMAAKLMQSNNAFSTLGEAARSEYDLYLEEFKSYLDIFRRCFYKEESG